VAGISNWKEYASPQSVLSSIGFHLPGDGILISWMRRLRLRKTVRVHCPVIDAFKKEASIDAK